MNSEVNNSLTVVIQAWKIENGAYTFESCVVLLES